MLCKINSNDVYRCQGSNEERNYDAAGSRWGIWRTGAAALISWVVTTQMLPFLMFSSGIVLPFLSTYLSSSSFVSWLLLRTSWCNLFLSFSFSTLAHNWICESCKRKGKIRMEGPPCPLLWSLTANLEICISESHCTQQTLPRLQGIAAMMFSGGLWAESRNCPTCGSGSWLRGSSRKASPAEQRGRILWSCDYAQSPVQFVTVKSVKVHQKKR